MTKKPLILLTNDDGIDSPVLPVLKNALNDVTETVIFAPDKNWSASGHPKTMHKMLRADSVEWEDGSTAYKSSGAPPDCVALAMLGVLAQKPKLVVSGINLGANMGYDLFYSGTVAAAVEGVIHGLPAIAFSRVHPVADGNYRGQAAFAARLSALVEKRFTCRNFFEREFPVLHLERCSRCNGDTFGAARLFRRIGSP